MVFLLPPRRVLTRCVRASGRTSRQGATKSTPVDSAPNARLPDHWVSTYLYIFLPLGQTSTLDREWMSGRVVRDIYKVRIYLPSGPAGARLVPSRSPSLSMRRRGGGGQPAGLVREHRAQVERGKGERDGKNNSHTPLSHRRASTRHQTRACLTTR